MAKTIETQTLIIQQIKKILPDQFNLCQGFIN